MMTQSKPARTSKTTPISTATKPSSKWASNEPSHERTLELISKLQQVIIDIGEGNVLQSDIPLELREQVSEYLLSEEFSLKRK